MLRTSRGALGRPAGRAGRSSQPRPPPALRNRRCPRRRVATGRVPGGGCGHGGRRGEGGGAGPEPAGLPQPPRLLLRPPHRRGDGGGRPAAARGRFLSGRCLRRCRLPARPSSARGQ